MKVFSDRDRDLEDARGVLLRRAPSVDFAYLDPRVAELAQIAGNPEILDRWERWTSALEI